MSHSLMTDVISGKNRKRRASLKVVLPIFTQDVSVTDGCLFFRKPFQQNEQRFASFIQIKLL
ncbi:hypothetical protein AM410_22590 [Enterobacter cloacae complex sp. FDA-CDC-AR_0164]|nr:hypothetical protein AM410_22590 [Enterobacter cloacae complex sp. FDA-CDC-AR_0164]